MKEHMPLAVALAIYLLPAALAVGRRHRRRNRIVAWNLLLGWTGLGWAACLVWACRRDLGAAAREPRDPGPSRPPGPSTDAPETSLEFRHVAAASAAIVGVVLGAYVGVQAGYARPVLTSLAVLWLWPLFSLLRPLPPFHSRTKALAASALIFAVLSAVQAVEADRLKREDPEAYAALMAERRETREAVAAAREAQEEREAQERAARKAREVEARRSVDAAVYCKDRVRASARFPTEADFAWFDFDYFEIGGQARYQGRAKLKNGFGNMMPHRYFCVFEVDARGQLTAIDFKMWEG